MKSMKTLLATAVAASAISAPAAMAEIELAASATVASTYLWRGFDLGSGTPAVSGDLVASAGGFYGGVWVSSGDTVAGTETDFFVGYGFEAGGLSVDLSVWNYLYQASSFDGAVSGSPLVANQFKDNGGQWGELSEVILSLGFGPVSFSYYDNVAGSTGYEYYTLGVSAGQFSFTLGQHDNVTGDDPLHLTVDYAFNDNFTLTASQFIADDEGVDNDTQFVVSYSLPF